MFEEQETLLPPTATDIARALDLLECRIGALPVAAITKDPLLVPVEMLDVLAWELSVDDWDTDWPEHRKRDVLLTAHDVHRHKGTPYGVLTAIEAMGYGKAQLIEGRQMPRLGGAAGRGLTRWPVPLGIGWVLGQAEKTLGLLTVGPQQALPLGREWTLGWADSHAIQTIDEDRAFHDRYGTPGRNAFTIEVKRIGAGFSLLSLLGII